MTDDLTEYLALVSQIGSPRSAIVAKPDEINSARSMVSSAYHAFLSKYGYAVFGNGSFQLVNPSKFSPVLSQIFREDKQLLTENMCLVGITAFGDLLVSQKDFGLIDVVFAQHWISSNEFSASFGKEIDQNLRSAIFAKVMDSDNYDEAGEPLFDRCLTKLGPLMSGQIYAPVLPPAAGGNLDISNYRVAQASVAISLNAQWDDFRLFDFADPGGPRFVRTIGQ